MSDAFTMRLLDLLAATASDLVDRLDADACAISRVIGDVLILVAESAPPGHTLQLGQGYLVPDYPLTQRVLSSREACSLTLAQDDVDAAEANVLRELGFASLLMLTLDLAEAPWGLVEIYRTAPRPFTLDELQRATAIVAEAAVQVV